MDTREELKSSRSEKKLLQTKGRNSSESYCYGPCHLKKKTKNTDSDTIHRMRKIRNKTGKRLCRRSLIVVATAILCISIDLDSNRMPLKLPLSSLMQPLIRVEGFTTSKLSQMNRHIRYGKETKIRPMSVLLSSPNINVNTSPNTNIKTPMMTMTTKHLGTTAEISPPIPQPIQSIHNLTNENSSSLTKSIEETSENDFWESVFSLQLPEGRCVAWRLNLPPILQSPGSSKLTMNNGNGNNNNEPDSISDDEFWRSITQSPPSYFPFHPDEVKFGLSLPGDGSRTTFFAGRLAIRAALNHVINGNGMGETQSPQNYVLDPNMAVLKDQYGRPTMPEGFLGSISHKRNLGVALVDSERGTLRNRRGIGVDIEQSHSRRQSVAKRVLTQREMNDLGKIKVIFFAFSFTNMLYTSS